MSRNTLFARLKEAAHDMTITMPDRIACKWVASDPVYIVAFDAWLDGPWHQVKDKMYGKEIAYAAGLMMDGKDYKTAWDEYRTYHIDPYRDDEKPDTDEEDTDE